MECLVRTDIEMPADYPAERKKQLIASEVRRGRELMDQGTIRRLWRVPGRWSAIALYEVDSIEDLHLAVSSLPLWPWMRVSVTYLSQHLLESNPQQDSDELARQWR